MNIIKPYVFCFIFPVKERHRSHSVMTLEINTHVIQFHLAVKNFSPIYPIKLQGGSQECVKFLHRRLFRILGCYVFFNSSHCHEVHAFVKCNGIVRLSDKESDWLLKKVQSKMEVRRPRDSQRRAKGVSEMEPQSPSK